MIKQTNSITVVVMICGALAFNLCAMQNEVEQLNKAATDMKEYEVSQKEKNAQRVGWRVSKNEDRMIELLEKLEAQQTKLSAQQAEAEKKLEILKEMVTMLAYETGRVEYWKNERSDIRKGPLVDAYTSKSYYAFRDNLSNKVEELKKYK